MIQTTFTIKQVNVDQALKLAEAKAEKAGKKIDENLNKNKLTLGDKLKGQIDKVTKTLKDTGVNLGGFDKLSGLLSSAAGPIAILTASLAALGKVGVEVFDQMTVSVEEYIKKKELALKDKQEKTNTEMKKQNSDNGYLERLRELSNAENLGNAGKREAVELIQILTRRYGDLGLSIDEVTGQIRGLDEAQKTMLQRQAKRNLQNLKAERADTAALADKKAQKAFIQFDKVGGFGWLDDLRYSLNGGMTTTAANATERFRGMSTKQQLEFLQNARSHATTDEQINRIQQVIELKKKQLQIEEELAELRRNGVISEADYAKRLKEETDKSNQAVAERQASGAFRERENIEEQTRRMRENADFSAMQTTGEQITFLQGKVAQERQKQGNLQGANAEIQSKKYDDDRERLENLIKIEDLERRIAELKKNPEANRVFIYNAEQQLNNLRGKTFRHDTDRAQDNAQIARNEVEIARSKQEQLRLEIEIEKLKKKSENYYKNIKDNLDGELNVQALILQGKFEEAERQKIINDLKAKGLKVDEKQIDSIMEKKRQLSGIQVRQNLKDMATGLYDNVNARINPKQAEFEKRKREIEKSTGREMDVTQQKELKQVIDLEAKLNDIKKPDFSKMQIVTNDLSRRGGFSSGVLMPEKGRVQEEMRDYIKQNNDLIGEIKTLIEKLENY